MCGARSNTASIITPATAIGTLPFFRGIESYKNRNYENANMWLNKTALEADVDAKFLLGRICRDGSAGTVDRVQALMWFYLASQNTLKAARRYFNVLAQKNPSQK